MYSFPSTSVTMHPSASRMNRGVPPTALNARTGELTPPGMYCCALTNAVWELAVDRSVDSAIVTSQFKKDHLLRHSRRVHRSCPRRGSRGRAARVYDISFKSFPPRCPG